MQLMNKSNIYITKSDINKIIKDYIQEQYGKSVSDLHYMLALEDGEVDLYEIVANTKEVIKWH